MGPTLPATRPATTPNRRAAARLALALQCELPSSVERVPRSCRLEQFREAIEAVEDQRAQLLAIADGVKRIAVQKRLVLYVQCLKVQTRYQLVRLLPRMRSSPAQAHHGACSSVYLRDGGKSGFVQLCGSCSKLS